MAYADRADELASTLLAAVNPRAALEYAEECGATRMPDAPLYAMVAVIMRRQLGMKVSTINPYRR